MPGVIERWDQRHPVNRLARMKVGGGVEFSTGLGHPAVRVSRWKGDFTIVWPVQGGVGKNGAWTGPPAGQQGRFEEVRFHPESSAGLVVDYVWERVEKVLYEQVRAAP